MKNTFILFGLFLLSAVANAQIKAGQPAPDISLPDASGTIIHLSSLKGKVVLVDFWASWCGPCRQANPHVVSLYEKYKAKGFEVFGVSIDSKKAAWLRAVQHDKIKYTQVNDANGWQAEALTRYNVDQIPTTFLLDRNGMIVAVDLQGGTLENKIKAMLE